MCCWHIRVCRTHIFFSSNWLLRHFLLRWIKTHHSLPASFSSFPLLQTSLLLFLSVLATWHCSAGRFRGQASGMEMRCTVALCQRAADWTLAWMVQQMFANFSLSFFKIQISPEYWLRSRGWRESAAVDDCSINPTWCVHVFQFDCMNYHKYVIEFTVCYLCLSVSACEPGGLEIGNRKLHLVVFSNLLVVIWGESAMFVYLKAKFSSSSLTFAQTMNLNLSGGRAAPAWLPTGLFMVCAPVVGVWLIAGSQDVGGFRWYFITLTSPFLIKSRPTLSLHWVTSSICIWICVCVFVPVCIVYTVNMCICDTTWYYWLGPHTPKNWRRVLTSIVFQWEEDVHENVHENVLLISI